MTEEPVTTLNIGNRLKHVKYLISMNKYNYDNKVLNIQCQVSMQGHNCDLQVYEHFFLHSLGQFCFLITR